MKKISVILTLLLATLLYILPIAAEPTLPRLVDDAGLLSNDEHDALLAQLDEISERHGCDVVIVTVDTLNGQDSYAYADDFFDNAGFGPSGILFLLDMDRREWTFSIAGDAMDIFTDARQNTIIDQIIDNLSGGAYSKAFHALAALCDDYLTEGVPAYTPVPDDPRDIYYDYDHHYDSDTNFTFSFGWLFIALGIGVLGGFLYTASLKAQLKSVSPATSAGIYTRAGSFKLTDSRDVFLYRNVTRRARQQNNGPHGGSGGGGGARASGGGVRMSSAGRSHSGSRGRF